MTRNQKEVVQYTSACGMLLSGTVLTFVCFFLEDHDIKDSVLYYMAQCFIYAGSIFGVSLYINNKFDGIRKMLEGKEDKKGGNE